MLCITTILINLNITLNNIQITFNNMFRFYKNKEDRDANSSDIIKAYVEQRKKVSDMIDKIENILG